MAVPTEPFVDVDLDPDADLVALDRDRLLGAPVDRDDVLAGLADVLPNLSLEIALILPSGLRRRRGFRGGCFLVVFVSVSVSVSVRRARGTSCYGCYA